LGFATFQFNQDKGQDPHQNDEENHISQIAYIVKLKGFPHEKFSG